MPPQPKGILKHRPAEDPSLFFRGGASLLKPNHITRYEYPCKLDLPLSSLRLQTPINASKRSRPQGRGDFGIDGSTFLTITRAFSDAPTKSDFDTLARENKIEKDLNALGRAMARVTKYAGNTLLQSGKFKLKDGMKFVIKRTTSIPLTDGSFGREEQLYEIPCDQWRKLQPRSTPGHDSWWMRLHDLYQGVSDRAVWSARETMDKYGIPAPLTEWFPRPDVEKAVTVYRKERHISDAEEESFCILCSRTWFEDSEYACQLKCGHWCCLECVTALVDGAGKAPLNENEKDPDTKYWRCPMCKVINAVLVDRADIIRPDEMRYWRYRIARQRLVLEVTDWLFRLEACEHDQWCAPLPAHLDREDADVEDVKKARTVCVHMPDAMQVMNAIPVFVTGLLDWGFSLDNPVNSPEGAALKKCLVDELHRLASSKRKFNLGGLEEHLKKVGDNAFRAVVVDEEKERLGNPVLPPGYKTYREWLCTWTARVCFYSPLGRSEILKFMQNIATRRDVWWKDERDVWFDRGAPV